MCGLCGYVERAPLAQGVREALTDALLLGIEHRGRDATGILAVQDEGAPFLLKAAMAATPFTKGRPGLPLRTRAVIGHTRLATQGAVEWLYNNHPVRVGGTYLAHNGHVHNQTDLRDKYGDTMQDVDSALLAALVDHTGPLAALDAFQDVEGAAAVTYHAPGRDGDVIVLARINGSPLYVWEGKKAVVWASTPDTVVKAWKAAFGGRAIGANVHPLKEGDALVIHPDGTAEARTFTPGSDGWTYYTPRSWAPVTSTLPAHRARKGKKVKASPSPKGGALVLAESVASCDIYPDEDYAQIERPGDHLVQCDGCQDYYTRTQDVVIGGEAFRFCASCAVWAEGAIWQ